MKSLNDFSSIILPAKNIVILPHIMADGDTLGSSVALYLALKKFGKNSRILLDEEIPGNLSFFIPKDCILKDLDDVFTPDLVITVDCSDLDRLGVRKKYLDYPNTLNIDHHKTNSLFAKYNYVDSKAAATGEIVFEILKAIQISLSKAIATALYVAISTDTGSFKYDNTTPKTHLISSELLKCDVDLNHVTTELYQSKPIYRIKLMAEALKTLEFHCGEKIGIISVTNEIMDKVGAGAADADGLIEIVRDLEGVEVGILLKEISETEIKVGFRSKYDIDVSSVALLFGGGGHKKAAGCTIRNDIQKAKEKIILEMKNIFR